MNKRILAVTAAVLMTLILVSLACSSSENDQMKELIARLYLNHKSLQIVYRDLHASAAENLGGPDRQLSHIQKTYLLVSEANLMCYFQWELLSVIDYIRQERRSDYFTLRVAGLQRVIFESKDRVNSLRLYFGYIEDAGARKRIDDAIGLIEANIYTFEQLVDILQPLANPPSALRPTLQG